uniref:Uncharacterized protein n=1 Tax=Syphacia muris TaxID=451379 RepID=A0A0N5AG11_9BILA
MKNMIENCEWILLQIDMELLLQLRSAAAEAGAEVEAFQHLIVMAFNDISTNYCDGSCCLTKYKLVTVIWDSSFDKLLKLINGRTI